MISLTLRPFAHRAPRARGTQQGHLHCLCQCSRHRVQAHRDERTHAKQIPGAQTGPVLFHCVRGSAPRLAPTKIRRSTDSGTTSTLSTMTCGSEYQTQHSSRQATVWCLTLDIGAAVGPDVSGATLGHVRRQNHLSIAWLGAFPRRALTRQKTRCPPALATRPVTMLTPRPPGKRHAGLRPARKGPENTRVTLTSFCRDIFTKKRPDKIAVSHQLGLLHTLVRVRSRMHSRGSR